MYLVGAFASQGEPACVAVAWAEAPKTAHDGCKEAGRPRCVRYWTRSGQRVSGTAAVVAEQSSLYLFHIVKGVPS